MGESRFAKRTPIAFFEFERGFRLSRRAGETVEGEKISAGREGVRVVVGERDFRFVGVTSSAAEVTGVLR
jgi:hypothetical protein